MITDFFGGVAQAEILPPESDTPTSYILPEASPTFISISLDALNQSVTPISRAEVYAANVLSVWIRGSGISRAWGSVGLVGLLVGWAAVARK